MGNVVNLNRNAVRTPSYKSDLQMVEDSLHTKKPCFKFPTILSKYRKNINAVKSIHNFLQESIIKKDSPEFTNHHEWCIMLLSDTDILSKIIIALERDINEYNKLLVKHKSSINKLDMITLMQTISKLSYIKDSFDLFKNHP